MFDATQEGGSVRWFVVKIHPRSETEIVLLSDRFLPLTLHWVGKSVPCCGDGCPLCCWLPGRGLFYAACLWQNRLSILELGSMSYSHFEQHCKLLHGGVKPGHVVRLLRSTPKAPVHTEVVDTRTITRVVSLLELAPRVMRLYQLPSTNPGEGLDEYSTRCGVIARRRAELEIERLKKKHEAGTGGR